MTSSSMSKDKPIKRSRGALMTFKVALRSNIQKLGGEGEEEGIRMREEYVNEVSEEELETLIA